MSKQRVMDDLDALLADLQSTTAHISPPPHNNSSPYSSGGQLSNPSPAHSSSHVSDSRSSTPPPPLPPPPTQDVLEGVHGNRHHHSEVNQVAYEPGVNKSRQVRTTVTTDNYSPHGHTPYVPPLHGPSPYTPHKQMSSLGNNLSELDSLLQDLSSAQFMAEVDRRNAVNGAPDQQENTSPTQQPGPNGPAPLEAVIVPAQRPPGKERTVESLLSELETFAPPRAEAGVDSGQYPTPADKLPLHPNPANLGRVAGPPSSTQPISGPPNSCQPISGPPGSSQPTYSLSGGGQPTQVRYEPPAQSLNIQDRPYSLEGPPAASTATRELDDLMASLSEFKVTDPAVPEHPYSAHMKPSGARGSMERQPPPSQSKLDNLLGDLSTDMSRQGITTVPKGHCAACAKPIIGQVVTALGKMWHPEHFVCTHCKEELGTQNFFERDEQPYCERDYHNLFSPRCALCHGPILDKCVTALDRTWHPEHFVCAQCGKMFGDGGFHEKEGQVYCREDYFDMFAPKCGGCGHPIMDNYISALSRQWHPECFVCYECRTPFGAGSFFEYESMPYCETHYHLHRGSLCAGCQKPITGRCITAMYKKFHPEHFVCAFCLKQLNKGTFKEQNDKPYCHPCFVKIFG